MSDCKCPNCGYCPTCGRPDYPRVTWYGTGDPPPATPIWIIPQANPWAPQITYGTGTATVSSSVL